MRNRIIFTVIALFFINVAVAWLWWPAAGLILLTGLLLTVTIHDAMQKQHSILRNYPLIGRTRWQVEMMRPYIQQYLLEGDTEGTPVNRMFRSIVYQRAKSSLDTSPFGTKMDTYVPGYEWIGHSLSARAVKEMDCDPRVKIGGSDCKQPYFASVLNISAMSFGSLSANAIKALNSGAAKGGFYHNTGEGGLTPYHLENGGDIVWQIGTGYFGCRDKEGNFNELEFESKAKHDSVKMIELKLSQGAKPGHGGILPAHKNTEEIARIRGVEPHTQVDSPPRHTAFSTPVGMLEFIDRLRKISGGKPVGFKLSLGRKSEFIAMCKAMIQTGIKPDFITVDGGEGGTGAAPLEYTNSIGFPLREALAYVDDVLIGFDLRKDIRVIASGKVFTAFHLVKNLSLGADLCNSARGMMMALGCVQSLSCHTNRCPTGVATQDPALSQGLDPYDKASRVFSYHHKTVHALVDILSSTGHGSPQELNRTHIFRRVDQQQVKRYDEIYPLVKRGCLLEGNIPEPLRLHYWEACAKSFMPVSQLADIEEETKSVSNG